MSGSTTAAKKPQGKVAHVIGVSLRHIRSNPINIMKDAQRRSTRAMTINFNAIWPKQLEICNLSNNEGVLHEIASRLGCVIAAVGSALAQERE
jgi:hypothetical protein